MTTDIAIRAGSFILILAIMGVAESVWPRRELDAPKGKRWFSNLSMMFIATLLGRLILPIAPAGFALYCADQGLGLFNLITLPSWLIFIISILLLDMVIYWQHVLFHKVPILWRLHRVHHVDVNIDASTGIRFHPIEILLSILVKFGAILLLGPPASAVIVFTILLNGCALFNHANVRFPIGFDRILRLLVVTPDMHRVHHSTNMHEANTNYGFNFPWWDRMFGTYKAQPDLGHIEMHIGLNIFREPKYLQLKQMLAIPFIGKI